MSVNWIPALAGTTKSNKSALSLGKKMEIFEQVKASIRAKVEHAFHVVKNLFRHRKTRNPGLEKNTAQLITLFSFANLVLVRRWWLADDGIIAS